MIHTNYCQFVGQLSRSSAKQALLKNRRTILLQLDENDRLLASIAFGDIPRAERDKALEAQLFQYLQSPDQVLAEDTRLSDALLISGKAVVVLVRVLGVIDRYRVMRYYANLPAACAMKNTGVN